MAYMLFVKYPNAARVSVSAWTNKKRAINNAHGLEKDFGAAWRLYDLSANGGWCEGNTYEPLDGMGEQAFVGIRNY